MIEVIVIAVGMFVLGWFGSQNWHIDRFIKGLMRLAMEEHERRTPQIEGQEVSEAEGERQVP